MTTARISGLPELKAALAGIAPKLRVRALRNSLTAGARLIQKEARRLAPVLKLTTYGGAYAYRKGYRKPGTVRKAISVRTSKLSKRQGDVGVFVNVRPVKGAARGARSYKDPYYWRWMEFGWNTGNVAKGGQEFLQGGAKKLGAALDVFIAKIGPQIAKLNKPKAPAP